MARLAVVALGLVALAATASASIAFGSRPVDLATVWTILTGGDADPADAAAVVGLRLPRTVVAILAGLGLGVAGAIVQAITRNPLADPGILGVTQGSAFFVAIAIAVWGVTAPAGYVWFALAGAFVATAAVWLIGATRRADPAQLVLSGVAIGAVLAGIIAGLRLIDPETFSSLQVWESGRLEDRGWGVVAPLWPFLAAGVVLALGLSPALNALSLGDDLATALGARVVRTRVLAIAAVALLAGSATAMAGPIGFVGLMIPHVARWLVGQDQRWIIAVTAILAPVLLLVADVVARVVLWPGEVAVGIVTAFLGAPVLIAIVRRRRVTGL